MDIDAPYITIPDTLYEGERDPTIDNPTVSSFTIIVDPAKVPEPRSKIVNQSAPTPVYFSTCLIEKRGCTIGTINNPQTSVHTIYDVDPVDADSDPANIEEALLRWDHTR
jgi:hypothetical protein